MTSKELKAIEAELERRGYRKYTHPLTLSESGAWFKNFDKEEDEEERVISGYQVAFRVWDFTNYDHPPTPTASMYGPRRLAPTSAPTLR